MESIYKLFNDIIAVEGVNHRVLKLARICKTLLLDADDELGEISPVYSLLRKYVLKMFKELFEEEIDDEWKMVLDALFELHTLLLKLT